MTIPQSVRGIQKKTRIILEKLNDLSSQRKFARIISKKQLAKKDGKMADVQICIQCIVDSYNCFLSEQFQDSGYPKRKQSILFNNLKTLETKINDSVKNNKPVPKRYISNVLKSQTIYFNSLKSKRINKDCSFAYDRLVLSSISVWNNDWNLSSIQNRLKSEPTDMHNPELV